MRPQPLAGYDLIDALQILSWLLGFTIRARPKTLGNWIFKLYSEERERGLVAYILFLGPAFWSLRWWPVKSRADVFFLLTLSLTIALELTLFLKNRARPHPSQTAP
jgi:hypothetical protein